MSKRVFITGGAAGIGRAIAERFLKGGAKVAVSDADPEAVAVARERLAPFGDSELSIRQNFCDLSQLQRHRT